MSFDKIRKWDYLSGYCLIVVEASFRVRYRAPEVRSLKSVSVNIYRRTPLRNKWSICRGTHHVVVWYYRRRQSYIV